MFYSPLGLSCPITELKAMSFGMFVFDLSVPLEGRGA